MPNNKSNIHAETSRIANAEDLLRKLSEYARTDSQALSDFFDDQKMVQFLIAQLKHDPTLDKQCVVLFATLLNKKNGQEILKTLHVECDEDPLLVGLLFQNPYMAETLFNKLKTNVTPNELFDKFFAKWLKSLQTSYPIEYALMTEALLKCLLHPIAQNISTETLAGLQAALTETQANMLTDTLMQTPYINHLVRLPQEQFDKIIDLLAKTTASQQDKQSAAKQKILTRIWDIHYEGVENFSEWISIPHQKNYCLAFSKYFFNPNLDSTTTKIPKKYIELLADCLSYPAVLTDRAGTAIITGLQQSLPSQAATLLSTLLLKETASFSTEQFKNLIEIFSASGKDAQFCMHYLEIHTQSFSQALTQQHQKAFIKGLDSMPHEATKKQLAAAILIKASNPANWRARLVNALPNWLCPNSLLNSALKSMAFDPAQIGALCEIVGPEKNHALLAQSRLLTESVRLFHALPVSTMPTAAAWASAPLPVASHSEAQATTPNSAMTQQTAIASVSSWATPPIAIFRPRPATLIDSPADHASPLLVTPAKEKISPAIVAPEIVKTTHGFNVSKAASSTAKHPENQPLKPAKTKQANCGYEGALFTPPLPKLAPLRVTAQKKFSTSAPARHI